MIRLFHILMSTYTIYLHLTDQNFVLVTPHRMQLHVTDKWLRAVDESKYISAVFLDLAKLKAFDTVDRNILCSKLTYYGFQGTSYDLLCDYLMDQRQRVLFNVTGVLLRLECHS